MGSILLVTNLLFTIKSLMCSAGHMAIVNSITKRSMDTKGILITFWGMMSFFTQKIAEKYLRKLCYVTSGSISLYGISKKPGQHSPAANSLASNGRT